MLLFFAALLPSLVSAPVDLPAVQKLPSPGVEYRMNDASASRAPWLDANGWRIQRGGKGPYYYDVKGDAASVAAAEAYAYGAEAFIHADEPGAQAFEALLPFLKQIPPADLPVMANIGVIDNGTDAAGELMNLLARRNLLFRIVPAPDPRLTVNVRAGERGSADPNTLSHQIRSELTDDKRLLRIYGSEVVIGRLTGDGTRARLHLIDYAKRPVEGLRIRVLGSYPRHEIAVFGAPGMKLADYAVDSGATEFTLPAMTRYAVIDLYSK